MTVLCLACSTGLLQPGRAQEGQSICKIQSSPLDTIIHSTQVMTTILFIISITAYNWISITQHKVASLFNFQTDRMLYDNKYSMNELSKVSTGI